MGKNRVIDKRQEDAAILGIPIPDLEPEKDFVVLKENWPAVELFLRCQTQWRTSVGGVIGFDYSGVIPLVTMYAYSKETFEGFQIMEVAAVSLLNKQGSK